MTHLVEKGDHLVVVADLPYRSTADDTARLDWLEQHGGLIGIRHVGYGDYRYYAGDGFKSVREVIDTARARVL